MWWVVAAQSQKIIERKTFNKQHIFSPFLACFLNLATSRIHCILQVQTHFSLVLCVPCFSKNVTAKSTENWPYQNSENMTPWGCQNMCKIAQISLKTWRTNLKFVQFFFEALKYFSEVYLRARLSLIIDSPGGWFTNTSLGLKVSKKEKITEKEAQSKAKLSLDRASQIDTDNH